MIMCFKKYLLPVFFMGVSVAVSHAKVVIFDRVTTVQAPISIGVQTRDGFFAAGGRLVDVYLDNQLLKKILTGGEAEGAFKDTVFSVDIRQRCRKVVRSISEHYQIIYLSRLLGTGITGSWLEKHDFPESAILSWNGPKMLDNLKKNGVQLHAIIGSPEVITAVAEKIEQRFSFEKTKDGKTVKNWEEILDLLVKSSQLDPGKKDTAQGTE